MAAIIATAFTQTMRHQFMLNAIKLTSPGRVTTHRPVRSFDRAGCSTA
jgi:hypothetical protein